MASDTSAAAEPSPLRVLVVEDQALLSLYVTDMLEELGCVATACVESGEQAVAAAHANPCDLALVDIGLLGKQDGIETAAVLRADFGIDIVFMSGASDSRTTERVASIGALGFLGKPFGITELSAFIATARARKTGEPLRAAGQSQAKPQES